MFVDHEFTKNQIKKYLASAARDFKIARDSAVPEIIFQFSYNSLVKLAVAVCAKNGLRVKSRAGHHAALLEKLAEFLGDKNIFKAGDEMRKKRNYDLYGGGILISEKEALEYRQWLKEIFLKAEKYILGADKLL